MLSFTRNTLLRFTQLHTWNLQSATAVWWAVHWAAPLEQVGLRPLHMGTSVVVMSQVQVFLLHFPHPDLSCQSDHKLTSLTFRTTLPLLQQWPKDNNISSMWKYVCCSETWGMCCYSAVMLQTLSFSCVWPKNTNIDSHETSCYVLVCSGLVVAVLSSTCFTQQAGPLSLPEKHTTLYPSIRRIIEEALLHKSCGR